MSTTAFTQLAREVAEREDRAAEARREAGEVAAARVDPVEVRINSTLPPGLRKPWQWVQPRGMREILMRLEDARSYAVHERERENMCSVAYGTLTALVGLLGQAERNLREDNRVALADAIAEAIK